MLVICTKHLKNAKQQLAKAIDSHNLTSFHLLAKRPKDQSDWNLTFWLIFLLNR
uniref:Uncharacterized protein n=1 Tax=Rhizophora mucronata TaxID=61149 RepID=A0A2P2N474_RHIMU